jgi:tetratricopeptide (TPR) repeat protein
VGEALDPQTWRPISDHELKLLAQRFRDKLEFVASQDDILLAGVFEAQGDSAKAARAYESAIQACAMNPSAWDAKESFLLRTGASQETLKAFHKAALTQFSNDRDRKASHQAALAEIVRKEGDEEEAGALEKSIVSQNKKQRSDLSIEMAARQLEDLLDKKKFDEAFAVYRKQVNNLGKTGGGNFFIAVVNPYVSALAESGDKERARDALKLARKAMSPDRDSPLESALRALEKDVN